jgi:hypothetical protein
MSYSERFPRYSYFTVSFKIVGKKEMLRTVPNTGIYYSSDEVGTILPSVIHFRKFHRQHQCTLQLV